MFILRFIGRILSIGFILFIIFIVSGKNAGAEDTWTAGVSVAQRDVAFEDEDSTLVTHSAITPR